ncbi:hypothetical protein L3Y34_013414 [Caenorhabditis briggsae]|uniref:Uncharacterized protein n=1 Tax=Caenorhabditis briggsae TaxID=6238 RepID=A0AAE8ZUA8_CAEBR|nr:hypothetical protein L3Y34_013414 [Caenorhabditis briggsae]
MAMDFGPKAGGSLQDIRRRMGTERTENPKKVARRSCHRRLKRLAFIFNIFSSFFFLKISQKRVSLKTFLKPPTIFLPYPFSSFANC